MLEAGAWTPFIHGCLDQTGLSFASLQAYESRSYLVQTSTNGCTEADWVVKSLRAVYLSTMTDTLIIGRKCGSKGNLTSSQQNAPLPASLLPGSWAQCCLSQWACWFSRSLVGHFAALRCKDCSGLIWLCRMRLEATGLPQFIALQAHQIAGVRYPGYLTP